MTTSEEADAGVPIAGGCRLPLEGFVVVELARNIAGPLCGMLLADLGAAVVKVERPGRGDEARSHGTAQDPGASPYFDAFNRNKYSVTIDLSDAVGREEFWGMLADADVLIDNFRPGGLARLGITDEALAARTPALIVSHVTGFGGTGPWASAPAYDHIIQGFSGLMSLTGPAEGGGYRTNASVVDIVTGLYTTAAILAALLGRERGSSGPTQMETSLLASAMNMLGYQVATVLQGGAPPERLGNQHPYIVPYGTFPTASAPINICVGNDNLFRKLCAAVGLAYLAADKRLATNEGRVACRELVNEALQSVLKTRPLVHWIPLLQENGIPCGPVYSLTEALADPQVQAACSFFSYNRGGQARAVVGPPFKVAGWDISMRLPPPTLGEHSGRLPRVLTGRSKQPRSGIASIGRSHE